MEDSEEKWWNLVSRIILVGGWEKVPVPAIHDASRERGFSPPYLDFLLTD